MMMRLLFWIALIVLVGMAVRTKLRAMLAPRAPGPQDGLEAGRGGAVHANVRADAHAHARVPDAGERMSCCAQCGLYFPSSEAVAAGGREYCCAAHARQAGQ